MEDTRPSKGRPIVVTVVCVLGGLSALVAATQIVSRWQLMVRESALGSAAAVIGLLVSIACLYGLWMMKRWAVILFAAALATRIVYGLAGGPPISVGRLVGPSLFLLVGLLYFRRMD